MCAGGLAAVAGGGVHLAAGREKRRKDALVVCPLRRDVEIPNEHEQKLFESNTRRGQMGSLQLRTQAPRRRGDMEMRGPEASLARVPVVREYLAVVILPETVTVLRRARFPPMA